MILRACLLAVVLLSAGSAFSELERSQQTANLRVAVDLVLLDVSVQDSRGQSVRDLARDNFKIFEDKIEQPISYFSTEESPVTWGLVLDRSGSMQGMMRDVHRSALNVIDQGTREDEMFLMTFSDTVETVSEFTSDRVKLANSAFGLNSDGRTALWDAVDSALDYIKKGQHRKKVLVVITDGVDNKSRIRFGRLVERVKESDVLIYTVGMYGAMADNPTITRMTGTARSQLRQLAETTGAYAHFPANTDKCREAMEKIAREVSEHYTIGYYPSNEARDGRWRKIRVAVVADQPNGKYVVRTRSGYYAPEADTSAQ